MLRGRISVRTGNVTSDNVSIRGRGRSRVLARGGDCGLYRVAACRGDVADTAGHLRVGVGSVQVDK